MYNSPKTTMQVQCAFKQGGGGIVGVEKTLSLSCNSKEREPVLRRLRVTPLGERGGQKESRDNI